MDAIDSIQVLGIDKVEQKAHVDVSSAGCRVWAGLMEQHGQEATMVWTGFQDLAGKESRRIPEGLR